MQYSELPTVTLSGDFVTLFDPRVPYYANFQFVTLFEKSTSVTFILTANKVNAIFSTFDRHIQHVSATAAISFEQ